MVEIKAVRTLLCLWTTPGIRALRYVSDCTWNCLGMVFARSLVHSQLASFTSGKLSARLLHKIVQISLRQDVKLQFDEFFSKIISILMSSRRISSDVSFPSSSPILFATTVTIKVRNGSTEGTFSRTSLTNKIAFSRQASDGSLNEQRTSLKTTSNALDIASSDGRSLMLERILTRQPFLVNLLSSLKPRHEVTRKSSATSAKVSFSFVMLVLLQKISLENMYVCIRFNEN